MKFPTRYRVLIAVLGVTTMFVVSARIFGWGSQTADVLEFSSIQEDWERVIFGHAMSGRLAPGELVPLAPVAPLVGKERAVAEQRLAEQCLQVADQHPGSQGALAALYLAASRSPDLDAGKQAFRRLSDSLASVDLGDFERALMASRVESPAAKSVFERIAPALIERVKQTPDHPKAAALLARICAKQGYDSQTETSPEHFTEAADLLAAQYADSPDIFNFCEILGGGMHVSPHWGTAFEGHLQTILSKNEHRYVRCTASLATASIVQLSIDRQAEAEKLYELFLAEYDGTVEGPFQNVEQMVSQSAGQRLVAMQFAPIGRFAPEIVGVDLDGKDMKLSDFRGKIVVVTFWATWCAPCMKLIPHERELAARLIDKPFAIVGVNGNTTEDSIQKAVDQFQIAWPSFRDERPGKQSISEEWNAFYPTVFLIDHKGIFRKRWTGEPPMDVLNRMVDELVAEAMDKDTN